MKLLPSTLKFSKISNLTKIAALAFSAMFAENSAQAQQIFGLRGAEIVKFSAATPTIITSTNTISGTQADRPIVAIDSRPATGALIAFGYNNMSGAYCLYNVNKETAVATIIGTGGTIMPNMMPVTFDFNPTVDRIRLMGFNGSNYRLNPITGGVAATDGNLNFAATDPNATRTPNIVTGAYTNNYIASTSTALYNIDTVLRVLTIQNPPNAGTQNSIVSAVADLENVKAIDIHFDSATAMNRPFVVRSGGIFNSSTLGSIDLSTGQITNIGTIGLTGGPVTDIAVEVVRSSSMMLPRNLSVALAANNVLVTFDTENPGYIVNANTITGLLPNYSIVGMDFRPADGSLWALGYNRVSGFARLYIINPQTAVATSMGTDTFALNLGAGKVSFDFNPTVDRIRLISDNGMNYRLNPITGGLAATDSSIRYNPADANSGRMPMIQAAGYINNLNGVTSTALYVIERGTGTIALQNPPNNGILNTTSTLSISGLGNMEMDIFTNRATGMDMAYVSGTPTGAMGTNLYSLNIMTGNLSLVGKIGQGIDIRDYAIIPDTTRPLSVSRSTALGTIKMYPNPAENQSNISFSLQKAQEIELMIFDALGRKVGSQSLGFVAAGEQTFSVNSQNLAKGTYQLVISGNKQRLGAALFIKK